MHFLRAGTPGELDVCIFYVPVLLGSRIRVVFFHSAAEGLRGYNKSWGLFACIFSQKNLSKTPLERRPNPSKTDVKNALFFNIDFFRFRPRFRRVLGLQVRRAACSARRVKSHGILCLH